MHEIEIGAEAVAEAVEDLMDAIMDQALTNAGKALRESGIKAQVVAEKTPEMYMLRVRSHRLSIEEHQRAEDIVQKALIDTMKKHTNPSHTMH